MSSHSEQAVDAHKCSERDTETLAALQKPGGVFIEASKCHDYGLNRRTCQSRDPSLTRY
jgi:hypothetical protein